MQTGLHALTTDGINCIDLYPASSYFTSIGLATVLATTVVRVNQTTGAIRDADISVNTTTTVVGGTQMLWSFIEYNIQFCTNLFQKNIASGLSAASLSPALGYADLIGTLVYQLGRAVGLGSSLIDATASNTASSFPAMFPYAQSQDFSTPPFSYADLWGVNFGATNCPCAGGCTYTHTNVSGAQILGLNARALQLDDVVAIARQYPSTSFTSNLGSISGNVSSLASATPGMVVVAVSATSPETNRVQTLAYGGGNYKLSGLVSGTYYVYVENVDQDPTGANGLGYYFGNADVPNYVFQGASGCVVPQPAAVQTEYYNTSDSAGPSEVQCTATAITLNPPTMNVTGINVVTSTATNLLALGVIPTSGGNPPYYSPRGVRFVLPGSGSQLVNLKITAGSGFAFNPYRIQFAGSRTLTMTSSGQLDQITQGTGSGIPSAINGTLDASGSAIVQISIGTASKDLTIYVQADVGLPSVPVYSNCSVIWVQQ
jgi:hypothetical protein